MRTSTKRYILLLIFVIAVFVAAQAVSALTKGNISSCGKLDNVGGTYNLSLNIQGNKFNLTGCYNVTANNVKLNCRGYYIRNTTLAQPVIYSNASNTSIINCNITGSNTAGGIGIQLVTATNVTINSTIVQSAFTGISITNGAAGKGLNATFTLFNVTSNSNAHSGIWINKSANITLTNVTASSNTLYGIVLNTSELVTLKNVTANSNTKSGIYLFSSQNNTFREVIANSNTEHGIFLYQSEFITFWNVTASSNTLDGIQLMKNSANNTLKNITANSNGDDGIAITINGTHTTLVNAWLSSNVGDGLEVNNTKHAILNNITSTGNEVGIRLFAGSTNISFQDAAVRNSNAQSIYINASANNSFTNFKINNSGQDGIYIKSVTSSNNNLTNVSVTSRNVSHYDIRYVTAGINGTWIINSSLGNYTFAGKGARVNFAYTYGRAMFVHMINGSGNNLTYHVRASNNSITAASNLNSGLNANANVTLYRVATSRIVNPVILENEGSCKAPRCRNHTSLKLATVIFNVTGWSTYSIGESLALNGTAVVLNSPNRQYNLTKNIDNFTVGVGVNISADNITLDCKNFAIINRSVAKPGIFVNASGVTIKNCRIQMNNTFTSKGIELHRARNATISNVTIGINYTMAFGILINGSSNGTIVTGVTINNTNWSIVINTSGNNTIKNTVLNNSRFNAITIDGTSDVNLSSVKVANTSKLFRDLRILNKAGVKGIWITDTFLDNYSFNGSGARINFMDSGEGIIRFRANVNGSGQSLTNDINISSNMIFVNSSRNSGINRSANITLFDLSFTTPKPQFDFGATGVYNDCTTSTEPKCTVIDITADLYFIFNVSHFTTFRAAESAVTSTGGPTGGGSTPSSSSSSTTDCVTRWLCTAWSSCKSSGEQTRTCVDKNNCDTSTDKPDESQDCTYVPSAAQPSEEDAAQQPQQEIEAPEVPSSADSQLQDDNAPKSGTSKLPVIIAILVVALIVGVSLYFINSRKK
ncbi:MAG TPA: right-handed parallel beta-helix repeat-containing protein [Candidatus Nanoarchaeia archaeon]|nr:right-handed parallel beta-helix repeat-containing protein [Candidatus Nanoarchaeia archaeon]